MQRHLVLMRHAKSSWVEPGMSDHQRPLDPRGRADAPRMGRELATRGWAPRLVVSSDAARTLETWALLAPELGAADVQVQCSERLYLGGLTDLRRHSVGWDSSIDRAMALGHNPGWSDAASILSGHPISMTTANCALLRGAGPTWVEALSKPWELVALLRPRELSVP